MSVASLRAGDVPGYAAVSGPCDLRFPEDHGPHENFRTEWWYYTGNLASAGGERFGFQLTFFRSRITPPGAETGQPQPASAWRSPQIFLAHAALSDITGRRYRHAELAARGVLGLAGAVRGPDHTRVFLKDWSAVIGNDVHHLQAAADDFELALTLTPAKPPVRHGRSGYSRKGSTPERASCYYSLTRLDTRGTVLREGSAFDVQGLSWMDHEFSSAPLESGITGWDWFSLQLDNGAELMLYLLRLETGAYLPASSGTFVAPDGTAAHLPADAFRVEVRDTWKSPRSGGVYPAGWRIVVPSRSLDLAVTPNLADQELQTPQSTGVTYWEGSVAAVGRGGQGEAVAGSGYVELTGYARPFEAPM